MGGLPVCDQRRVASVGSYELVAVVVLVPCIVHAVYLPLQLRLILAVKCPKCLPLFRTETWSGSNTATSRMTDASWQEDGFPASSSLNTFKAFQLGTSVLQSLGVRVMHRLVTL